MRQGTPGCPEARWKACVCVCACRGWVCVGALARPPTHPDAHTPLCAGQRLAWERAACHLLPPHIPHTPRSAQINDWLVSELPEGARVGIDPFVHTIEAAEKLARKLRAAGRALVPLPNPNPVDGVWGAARPAPPTVRGARARPCARGVCVRLLRSSGVGGRVGGP